MSNTRKSLIPQGTVKSPGTSLVDSIINRDRAQTGRARPTDEEGNTASNIASNTTSNTDESTASRTSARTSRKMHIHLEESDAEDAAARGSAVIGSRRRIPMTTITVRIPTEINEWIADLVHERSAEGITKQDVIVSALRLLRDHEETATDEPAPSV